jgi:hypothetical protein
MEPQKLLPAVVRKQPQFDRLLQVIDSISGAAQTPGMSDVQVPASWARHLRVPFLPSQIPEQH